MHNPDDQDGSQNAGHHSLGARRNQATSGIHRHKIGTMQGGFNSQPLFNGEAPEDMAALIDLLEEYGLDGSAFTGGGGGGVTDHGALSGLGDNDHPQYLTEAEADALYSLLGHTHGAWTRTSKSIIVIGVADLDTATGSEPFETGYRLLNISTDRACRVRLYTTAAKRTADLARPIGTDVDISTDHGLVFEYVSTGAITDYDLSPLVDGYNPAGGTSVYYSIQNRSGSLGTVVVEFDYIRTE